MLRMRVRVQKHIREDAEDRGAGLAGALGSASTSSPGPMATETEWRTAVRVCVLISSPVGWLGQPSSTCDPGVHSCPGNGRDAGEQTHQHGVRPTTIRWPKHLMSKSRGGDYTRATVRLWQGVGITFLHHRDKKQGE